MLSDQGGYRIWQYRQKWEILYGQKTRRSQDVFCLHISDWVQMLGFPVVIADFPAACVIVGDVAGTDIPYSKWRRGYRVMHVRADKV